MKESFTNWARSEGTRAAFLAFLADDSIVFQPGPVNGKEAWKKKPEKGISLTWKPLFGAIARSADLAYTTGPAEWRHNKEDAKPFGYGQFVSIWKKQKDGGWKVALDVGSEVPGPVKTEDVPPLELSFDNEAAGTPGDLASAKRRLSEAEAKFATAAKADSTIALSEAGSPNLRVHREGVFPAVGRDAARLMLSVRRGNLTLDRLGGAMSAAGDLAYGYGKYSLVRPENTERGHYLQIWRDRARRILEDCARLSGAASAKRSRSNCVKAAVAHRRHAEPSKLLLDIEEDEALPRIFQRNRIAGDVVRKWRRIVEDIAHTGANGEPSRTLGDAAIRVFDQRPSSCPRYRLGAGGLRILKAILEQQVEGGGIVHSAIGGHVFVGIDVVKGRENTRSRRCASRAWARPRNTGRAKVSTNSRTGSMSLACCSKLVT